MKKKLLCTLLTITLALAVFALTACGDEDNPFLALGTSSSQNGASDIQADNGYVSSGDSVTAGGDSEEAVLAPYSSDNVENTSGTPLGAMSPDGIAIADRWDTELGTYFVAAAEGSTAPLLLHMTDRASGSTFVLCPRPDCRHDSADCGAYLPPPIFEGDVIGNARHDRGGGVASGLLFADGEHIFSSNGGNTIYRFNLDGSGRTEAVRIPDEYMLSPDSGIWLLNGKLYAQGSIVLAIGDEDSPEFMLLGVGVVIEIDYQNGTVRELHRNDYSQTLESDGEFIFTTVFGLWDGKVFFRERHMPAWDDTDRAAIMANFDNQRTTLFSIDPRTNERTTVHSAILSEASEPAVMGRAGAVFHSRSQNAMVRLDLLTGETAVLAENIHGYIQVDRELGGRLLLEHWSDHPRSDANAFDRSNLLALNLATGEVSEITLRITTNMGQRGAMRIVREENGYFYIEVEQELERQEVRGSDPWYSPIRHRMGRIPLEDYFAGNAAAIELLGWYTANDWFTWEREIRGR
ncbi:MAG: hypothetical protein FWC20_03440 [Oscillospiraceae bacterium]|nr:hypothetical protein [Oscillospiraceae bacterium]